MKPLTVGLGGVRGHGCVALAEESGVLSVCEQERVTRVRGAAFNPGGLPDQALDLLLSRAGASRANVTRYAIAEDGAEPGGAPVVHLDHHHAHACAAYLTSSGAPATIVVCDGEAPKLSVWKGIGSQVIPVEWRWEGDGFSDLYAACARVVGFGSGGGVQRFEALARLAPARTNDRIASLFDTDGHRLITQAGWEQTVSEMARAAHAGDGVAGAAPIASALQGRLVELFLQVLADVRRSVGGGAWCLGGGLFYHSSINTAARESGICEDVFVPVDPGNAGLAVGTALAAAGVAPHNVPPFMGPRYEPDEIKSTLDNCKVQYTWVDESEAVAVAVDALRNGRIVGWFEGAMEWGPRALGARSILANPFAPYVLENLNHFLKHREPWRGYALSALDTAVATHFTGPERAPFMECDYRPRDASSFTHVLPVPEASIRVQTVDAHAPPRFRALLEAFGTVTGIPCVLNTSFNGFHEPIVCTPRDAVRVFFGSGIDVLLLDRFLLTK